MTVPGLSSGPGVSYGSDDDKKEHVRGWLYYTCSHGVAHSYQNLTCSLSIADLSDSGWSIAWKQLFLDYNSEPNYNDNIPACKKNSCGGYINSRVMLCRYRRQTGHSADCWHIEMI